MLYVDGEYHIGRIGGATTLSSDQTHARFENAAVRLKGHKVWWQELSKPPVD